MSSLMANQNNVISEILEKLKDAPVDKPGRDRRKRSTPRRKAGPKYSQEPKNTSNKPTAKTKKETSKKEVKKSNKIKKEPVEYKGDIGKTNEVDSDVIDADDDDLDPNFEDDDDDDVTYDPKEQYAEGRRGRKRKLSRNIRTGKVLRSAKKLKITANKPRERKGANERKKRKERKGRVMAIDLLKEKLENLTGDELADLGIRKLEQSEIMGKPLFFTYFQENVPTAVYSMQLD